MIDASAFLAVCKAEPGWELAHEKMRGGLISAVNLSEVIQKATKLDRLSFVERLIITVHLTVVPFDRDQAEIAARLFPKTCEQGISLADRACLALGLSRNCPVVTGDRVWQQLDIDAEIIYFRPSVN